MLWSTAKTASNVRCSLGNVASHGLRPFLCPVRAEVRAKLKPASQPPVRLSESYPHLVPRRHGQRPDRAMRSTFWNVRGASVVPHLPLPCFRLSVQPRLLARNVCAMTRVVRPAAGWPLDLADVVDCRITRGCGRGSKRCSRTRSLTGRLRIMNISLLVAALTVHPRGCYTEGLVIISLEWSVLLCPHPGTGPQSASIPIRCTRKLRTVAKRLGR